MKPYFETKLGKLYNGDCLNFMQEMEDKSVDLVLTDPPYNLNYTGRGEIANSFDNDNLDDSAWSVWFNFILHQTKRVLADNTAIYIWIDWRHYPVVFNLMQQFYDIKNCIVKLW